MKLTIPDLPKFGVLFDESEQLEMNSTHGIGKRPSDSDIIDFLKHGIGLLEDRIKLTEGSASFLLALHTAFLGATGFITKEFLLDAQKPLLSISIIVFFLITLGIAVRAMLLLISTIRPFSRDKLKPYKTNDSYVLWFSHDFPASPEEYAQKISAMSTVRIRRNYEQFHFTLLQLIKAKYSNYRLAISWTRYTMIIGVIGIFLFGIFKVILATDVFKEILTLGCK